jgi:hypothetical protein
MCLLHAKRIFPTGKNKTITCYKVVRKMISPYTPWTVYYTSPYIGYPYIVGKEYMPGDRWDYGWITASEDELLRLSSFLGRIGRGAYHTFKTLEDAKTAILRGTYSLSQDKKNSSVFDIAILECEVSLERGYVYEGSDEVTSLDAYASSSLKVIREVE